MSKKETTKQEFTREELYQKNFLAKFYDRLVPGDYTIRQDFYHTLTLFIPIAIIFILLIALTLINVNKNVVEREAQLTIPASSFVSGQEQNVVDMLNSYGFVDIQKDANGNMTAKGSNALVQKYQDAFYKQKVEPALSISYGDKAVTGLDKLEYNQDEGTLDIYTQNKLDSSTILSTVVVSNDSIANAISVCSQWTTMKSNGEKTMQTRFFVSGNDEQSQEPYITSYKSSGNGIVSEAEYRERQESTSNTTNTTETNTTADTDASSQSTGN